MQTHTLPHARTYLEEYGDEVPVPGGDSHLDGLCVLLRVLRRRVLHLVGTETLTWRGGVGGRGRQGDAVSRRGRKGCGGAVRVAAD